MLDPSLINLLRCPMGKSELELVGDYLICKRCGPKFPIKDGIPVMLIEEAVLPDGCRALLDLPCVKDGTTPA